MSGLVHSPQEAAHTQPGSAKTVADILTAAADLIAKPGAWQQGSWFNTTSRRALNGDYACMCAEGAIILASGSRPGDADESPAYAVLSEVVGSDVPSWNDDPERTQAEVVAALRAAAAKAATTASSLGTPEGVNPK